MYDEGGGGARCDRKHGLQPILCGTSAIVNGRDISQGMVQPGNYFFV